MDRFDIKQSFENVLENIIAFLPNVFAALIILIIGAIVAAIVTGIIRRVLKRLRFDRAIHSSAAGAMVSQVVESPVYFVGRGVYWLIMLGAISLAAAALNLPLLNDFLGAIYSYVPNVIAAIAIFLVASAVSVGTVKFVQRVWGRTPLSSLVATAIPAITLSLAVFMILNQLGVATDIVNILFTAIVGSAALGLALAFGLGGRDVARDILEQAADIVKAK